MIDDFVQDALDQLDKSEANYLLIIPFGRRTIFNSNLAPQNAAMMIEGIRDGWFVEAIVEHLQSIVDNGDQNST